MQIFNSLNENKGLSIALGFFDGVHLGHQAVIKSAVDFAKKHNSKSAVITFQDHPHCFFHDLNPEYIIKRKEKIDLIKKLGIDYLYFIKFDEELANLSAEDYLKNILIKNFEPIAISTGFNHTFGAKKSGDVNLLNEKQNIYNYLYFEIPPVIQNNEIISSTTIRKKLAQGNIKEVNEMLGYTYGLEETVVYGQQLGRKLGFKTANLIYPKNLITPKNGVYSALVKHNGKTYKAVANNGTRPTIDKNLPQILEVHILDFDENIYGEKIEVRFLDKIRSEKQFENLDELKAQIQKDVKFVEKH